MALKKDKQKVLGETFDRERIATFLDQQSPDNINNDYYVLERAYRGMNADNFATFIELFCAAGRNLEASNEQGVRFIDVVKSHRLSTDYLKPIEAALKL